jgi:hypothetical protein
LCNSNDELFLFEESFQRDKEEKRVEKIRNQVSNSYSDFFRSGSI